MTFSEKAKLEILNKEKGQPCCQLASLSAFLRGAGSISVVQNNIGFEIVTENKEALEYYKEIISDLYGENLQIESFYQGKKYKMALISSSSVNILKDLAFVSFDGNGISLNLVLDKYLVENDCCKRAYIVGAFVGGGSVTVPSESHKSSTSYHLEFVFSKYQTASDFASILTQKGFLPKLTERKESYIVYFKNGDEISELLFFIGATKCCFELKDIVINKDIRNDTNRRINCEIANIDKQIIAGENQVKRINTIIETIGLDSLSEQLKQTALLRLENPESSLEELSKLSGLTKSCLNHRLRKIMEIANNL
jgi:DNA-binding protein WhiA